MGIIIAIGSVKGGTGKSCVAQNLVVCLHYQNYSTVLVDIDPQGTAIEWGNDRAEFSPELPTINCVRPYYDVDKTLEDLADKYDFVIVDAGGHDSDSQRLALAVADVGLFPIRPKRRDLKTLHRLDEIVTGARRVNAGITICSLVSQCPTHGNQYSRVQASIDALASYDLNPLQSLIYSRNIWDDAEEDGSTVYEFTLGDKKAKQKATAEMDSLAAELIAIHSKGNEQ